MPSAPSLGGAWGTFSWKIMSRDESPGGSHTALQLGPQGDSDVCIEFLLQGGLRRPSLGSPEQHVGTITPVCFCYGSREEVTLTSLRPTAGPAPLWEPGLRPVLKLVFVGSAFWATAGRPLSGVTPSLLRAAPSWPCFVAPFL